MMINTKKIIVILILILALISINIFTFALDDPGFYEPNEIENNDSKKAGEFAGKILHTVRDIGIILAFVILAVIGLKYVFSSLEEKANYKENAVPYLVGCFLLASATTIPSIIYDLMNS